MASDSQSVTIDGKVIGEIRDISCDNFFVFGTFKGAPAFEEYSQIFDRQKALSELLEQDDPEGFADLDDERHTLQERIDALNIHVGETLVRDFNVSEAPRCEFKFVLENPTSRTSRG